MGPSKAETIANIIEQLEKDKEEYMQTRCYACGQEKKSERVLAAGTIVQHREYEFDTQPYIVSEDNIFLQYKQHGTTKVIGFKDGRTRVFVTGNLRIVHGYLHIESREA